MNCTFEFNATKWRCPSCDSVGTLCAVELDTIICRPVTAISDDYITTKSKLYLGGKFGGYICCNCEIKVADTPEELKNMFLQQVRILQDQNSGLWKVMIKEDHHVVQVCFGDSDDALTLSKLLEKATSIIILE